MVSPIIVAGGHTTGLRPLSLTIHKSILPVLGKPLMDYIIEDIWKVTQDLSSIYISARVRARGVKARYARMGIQVIV